MSKLRIALEEYLKLRSAVGYKVTNLTSLLRGFVDFADRAGADFITTELALSWAIQPAKAQPRSLALRLGMVRQFARHCSATDPRTIVPPPDLIPYQYRRPSPYLYRDEQITRLLQAAQGLPSAAGLRSHTYATLFGLYVATGMRHNEALQLNREDVDLVNGVLTIRGTKFGKSRYVPLHPTATRALQRYAARRDRLCRNPISPSFFLSERGTRLHNHAVRRTFVKLCCDTGIRRPGDSRGPRLHDLRHRLAIKTLLKWYQRGIDVEQHLPVLSTYLGHTEITDTYWYLFDLNNRVAPLCPATCGAIQARAATMKGSITFSTLLESFFLERLMQQRRVSPHTIASYRDTFRLLLQFTQKYLGKAPSSLAVSDLTTALLSKFLDHLESDRRNTARSRNVRLAAIRSFFHYVARQAPEYSAIAQRVLDMPSKRYTRRPITFLTRVEVDALLAAPDLNTWWGRRDRALILLAVQTGLRAAELLGLRCQDIVFGSAAHVWCEGKGRKERCTPLRKDTAAVLGGWLKERQGKASDPVFPTVRGTVMSHDALQNLLNEHLTRARRTCVSLRKKHVTPHSLRHSLAMDLLQNGVDRSVIALWLGHESAETTSIYLHADMTMKERALQKTGVRSEHARRYRPDDRVMAFLRTL